MGFWSSTRNFAGHIVNVRVDKWIGVATIRDSTNSIYRSCKSMFKIAHPERIETFDQALERLNITEAELYARQQEFFRLFVFYLVASLALFIYCVFLAFNGNFMGFCMSFALTIYALTHSFRYHFWQFQIKERKLGCTFKDWLDAGNDPK